MFKSDERTEHIFLKGTAFSYMIILVLSIASYMAFSLRRDGYITFDDDTMERLLAATWIVPIIFFALYRWRNGMYRDERELNSQTAESRSFAFKNSILIGVLGSLGISIFNYFFTFKGDLEMTLLTGFILAIGLPFILTFSNIGKVKKHESI